MGQNGERQVQGGKGVQGDGNCGGWFQGRNRFGGVEGKERRPPQLWLRRVRGNKMLGGGDARTGNRQTDRTDRTENENGGGGSFRRSSSRGQPNRREDGGGEKMGEPLRHWLKKLEVDSPQKRRETPNKKNTRDWLRKKKNFVNRTVGKDWGGG